MYTKDQLEKALKDKSFVWFDSDKDYDLNIIGVRNESAANKLTNLFDDTLYCIFKIKGNYILKGWEITTDPGKKALLEAPKKGVARLVPGQYRRCYALGLHQGKYEALRQVDKVKVYRDADRDLVHDENKIEEGLFGINIHKAGVNSTYVENWSEGCQVFKKTADFNEFIKICNAAKKIHGNVFTYTLILSTDVK